MIVEVKPSRAESLMMKRGNAWMTQEFTCYICKSRCSFPGTPAGMGQVFTGVWANTEGRPYKAYLCPKCKDKEVLS